MTFDKFGTKCFVNQNSCDSLIHYDNYLLLTYNL